MTIPALPSSAVPVAGKNDQGKKVKIHSIGQNLDGKDILILEGTGTVISGPYTFTYKHNKEDKGVKRRGATITSTQYWQVLVHESNAYLSFVESELTF